MAEGKNALPPDGELAERLGYRFRQKNLLEEALTHPSLGGAARRKRAATYERLEFLGDRVLDFGCTDAFMSDDKLSRVRNEKGEVVHVPLALGAVVPTYNTPLEYLLPMVESVRQQTYANWELCIADDASQDPYVIAMLRDYADRDPRIKVDFRKTNSHISATSNAATAPSSSFARCSTGRGCGTPTSTGPPSTSRSRSSRRPRPSPWTRGR